MAPGHLLDNTNHWGILYLALLLNLFNFPCSKVAISAATVNSENDWVPLQLHVEDHDSRGTIFCELIFNFKT
jgi:hypothetical protein